MKNMKNIYDNFSIEEFKKYLLNQNKRQCRSFVVPMVIGTTVVALVALIVYKLRQRDLYDCCCDDFYSDFEDDTFGPFDSGDEDESNLAYDGDLDAEIDGEV